MINGYITQVTKWRKTTEYECSHPLVSKVWATGSLSTTGVPATITFTINIYLKDNSRKEFSTNKEDEMDNMIVLAEEWLQTLNQ